MKMEKNMGKKNLFVVLTVILLFFVGCNGEKKHECDPPNVIVTGTLMFGPSCPVDIDCDGDAGWGITNNRGVFMFDWSEYTGDMFLTGLREGQRILVCGTTSRIFQESDSAVFFNLKVSRVIR